MFSLVIPDSLEAELLIWNQSELAGFTYLFDADEIGVI